MSKKKVERKKLQSKENNSKYKIVMTTNNHLNKKILMDL
jgi:hypothetical protein